MPKRRASFCTKLIKGKRGQSMVVYAVVTAAILGGLATMGMVLLPEMMDAYDNFTESLFFGINMPFP